DLCGLAKRLGEGDLAGVAQDVRLKAVPAALAAVGVPPAVSDGAIRLAQGLLGQKVSADTAIRAVGQAYGAQGLAALAGALAAAF
ncbi:MAG: hypothetical protein ABDI20_05975, partial [Candidatus Bipolaricaulaceae bacterium]